MPQLVYVTNVQKFCTHDGPGIRTNVFFKGCSMECQWCANPETIQPYPQLLYYSGKCTGCGKCVSACTHNAIDIKDGHIMHLAHKCTNCGRCAELCPAMAREIVGSLKTPEEIFEEVNQDKIFYETTGGGVTFSGGEPLLHPDFIYQVASKCKAEGYNTAVETCGNFCLEPVLKIIDVIDCLLFDIKIIDNAKHIRYCGQPNEKIHRNFEALLDKTRIIPRVPIIPGINDTPADIAQLCNFFEKHKNYIYKIHILPYHNMALGKYDALGQKYMLNDLTPPPESHMQEIKRLIENCGFEVHIGG